MSGGWPFCVSIGCKHAGKDLSGDARRRYATGEHNVAQKSVYLLGSFVVGTSDKAVCLCGPCLPISHDMSS